MMLTICFSAKFKPTIQCNRSQYKYIEALIEKACTRPHMGSLKVIYISYITGNHALPDITIFIALGHLPVIYSYSYLY